jgi:hypothetical protein
MNGIIFNILGIMGAIGGLFMGGIKIEHNVSNYPKGIRLFTPYYKLLYEFISTR